MLRLDSFVPTLAFAAIVAAVWTPSGARCQSAERRFPEAYSLRRPLLSAHRDALIAGNDWQALSSLESFGFMVGRGRDVKEADASAVPTPQDPTTKRAQLVADPTFGQVVRLWQTDESDGFSRSVRYVQQVAEPVNRIWYRVLLKFQPGFTTRGPGGGNASWKMIFGTYQRLAVLHNVDAYVNNFHRYAGSERCISGTCRANWSHVESEWSDGEWYEFIFYEERLDGGTTFRLRRWVRRLTSNGMIDPNAPWRDRMGMISTGASVPARTAQIELGVNRNRPMERGTQQWWMWGPWEMIDGDVLPDPYGLASDMLP